VSYIYTRKHHKEDISIWGRIFREILVRGSIPRDSSIRGSIPNGKLPLSLMSKGEKFIRCMERKLDSWRERERRGMIPRGVMVTGGA
jgi:hypothetical protein